jgi:GntR family transcriptional regulator
MTVIDRTSPMPLWAQIAEDLRGRIAKNEFDERFPTDEEMVREYEVSRQTVREAVRQLERNGVVERQRGRGSFLRKASSLEQPVQGFYSLARSIEAQGLEERSSVLTFATVRDEPAARELGLAGDAPLLFIERLRFADGQPLALDRSWLPEEIGGLLEAGQLEHGSLYEEIANRGGVAVTGGRERIRASAADARTRRLLDLPRGEAVLAIERLMWAGTRPIEWRIGMVRGDRFSFTAEWG